MPMSSSETGNHLRASSTLKLRYVMKPMALPVEMATIHTIDCNR